MPIELVQTLVGILSALITAVLGVKPVQRMLARWRSRRELTSVLDGMNRTREAYGLIHQLCDATTADRVILFAGHDNGGLPRAHSPFWVSAMYTYTMVRAKFTILSKYVNLTVDQVYIAMLLQSERDGYLLLETATMPDCQLKQYYLAEHVTFAMICFVAVREKKFVYLSIAKYAPEPFPESDVTNIQLYVNQLKGLV